MITILGATGNVGSKIAEMLAKKGEKVRLIARSVGPAAATGWQKDGGNGRRCHGYGISGEGFHGLRCSFYADPAEREGGNFSDYADKIGESIARAVEIARIDYVVNLSSIGAELSSGTGPIVGLHNQEERLNKIPGLNVLHIRAGYFMENLLMNLDMIKRKA